MSELLTDESELLFRQIHPTFIQDGQISSQPFCPTSKDNNKLSVDRASLTTASNARDHFLQCGGSSAAVFALSVKEFVSEALPCHHDPIEGCEDQFPNPSHAFADYSAHSQNQQKAKAKRLKIKATARGPQVV